MHAGVLGACVARFLHRLGTGASFLSRVSTHSTPNAVPRPCSRPFKRGLMVPRSDNIALYKAQHSSKATLRCGAIVVGRLQGFSLASCSRRCDAGVSRGLRLVRLGCCQALAWLHPTRKRRAHARAAWLSYLNHQMYGAWYRASVETLAKRTPGAASTASREFPSDTTGKHTPAEWRTTSTLPHASARRERCARSTRQSGSGGCKMRLCGRFTSRRT